MEKHQFKSDSGHFQNREKYSTASQALEWVSERTSERCRAREWTGQRGMNCERETSKWISERKSGWACGPLLTSRYQEVLNLWIWYFLVENESCHRNQVFWIKRKNLKLQDSEIWFYLFLVFISLLHFWKSRGCTGFPTTIFEKKSCVHGFYQKEHLEKSVLSRG